MQIEHNPNERRETNAIYWILWPIIALGWLGSWYFDLIQWHSVALGGFTMAVLVTWATEVTGNKVPDWMAKNAQDINKGWDV